MTLTQSFPYSFSVFAARRRQQNEETTLVFGVAFGLVRCGASTEDLA